MFSRANHFLLSRGIRNCKVEELEIAKTCNIFYYLIEHRKEESGPMQGMLSAASSWFRVLQGQQPGWAEVWIWEEENYKILAVGLGGWTPLWLRATHGVGDVFLVKICCDPGMLWITFPITCRLLVCCACVLGSRDISTSHLHHFSPSTEGGEKSYLSSRVLPLKSGVGSMQSFIA